MVDIYQKSDPLTLVKIRSYLSERLLVFIIRILRGLNAIRNSFHFYFQSFSTQSRLVL